MADRIEKDSVISPDVNKEIKELNKNLAISVKLMTDLTKASIDLQKNTNPQNLQQVTAAQKESNTLSQESVKVNNERISTTEKLRDRINSVSKEEERLKIQLQKRRKEVRETIKAEKAQAGSINDLNRKNKILRERIRDVSNETASGRKRILAYNKVIDRNTKKVNAASDAYTRQKRNIGNYKDTLKGLGSTLGLVTGGVALAGAAIKKSIQITKQAIEVNRLFEKSFANVLTLLDEAEKKEFRVKLAQGSIDLVANYGLAIEDTNKALFDAISAGVSAGESIEFLDKASRLAIAGNAELADVVDGATNIMNAYGDQIKNTDDVFNAFFAAQVDGKTTVAELARNIGKLAPIAASVDFGMNELLGTTALLTKQIGSTEEATTVLRQVMAAVIKPGREAADTFDKLGISYGASAIKEEGFLNIFKQVTDAAIDNEDVLAELIPSIRALTGASAIGTEQFNELEVIISELNDTELSSIKVQEAFNEQMATGAKQAELLEGRWKRLLITIGGGESVFKKLGTAIRASLSKEIDEVTEKIEIFEVTWDRLTRQITKEEFRTALIDIKERFHGVGEASGELSDDIISDNEDVTNSFKNESNERINISLKERDKLKKIKKAASRGNIETFFDEKERILTEEEIAFNKQQEQFIENLQKRNDAEKEFLDASVENQRAADEAKRVSTQWYTDFAISTASMLSSNILGFLDVQINAQETADIRKAESRGASEEEIAKIEEKAANKRKQIAYLDIAINTALGVTKAFVENSWVEALLISAGIIAEAAIQTAAIESASFAKGTTDSGDSWLNATVAEKGVERINLADGTSFLTPNKETQMYLPPHSEVVPNHRLQQDLAEMQMVGSRKGSNQESDYIRRKEQKEIIRAIQNRDETTINITEGGFSVTAQKGANRTKYINRKYRG